MVTEQVFDELSFILGRGKNCSIRLFWLISVPLLLFLFSIAGYIGIINFNIKIHSVMMLGGIFLIYIFFMKHNAYFASCTLRENFILVKNKLILYMNKNLLSIAGIEKANASLDDFLSEISKTLRNENFSSVAAGVFPTLGILGTFISIAVSMPDFSVQTTQLLEQEISKLLGGVGTAFYVSIYGIFLSLWWIFFEKTGMSRFQNDANEIKEYTRDFFWGKEEIEQTYFRKSMENFEKLNTVFDTISSEDFINSLNKTLAQRVNVFEQIIKHEQEAATKVAKMFENATNQQDDIFEGQKRLTYTLENIIQKFELFANNLEEQNIHFNKANNALKSEFSHASMVAEVLSQSTKKLSESLSNISADNIKNLYSGVIQNVNSLKKDIDMIGLSFETKMDSFDAKFLDKLQTTLEMIDSETAQIVTQLSKLKENGND